MVTSIEHLIQNEIVFIVGAPRSGTTWVQRLLASHEKIITGQETHLFNDFVGPQIRAWRMRVSNVSSGRGGVGLCAYLREDEFLEIVSGCLAQVMKILLRNCTPDKIFLDKSPSHSFFLREIMLFLPSAKIIHILRDGRDVAASLVAASQDWASGWAPSEFEEALEYWINHVWKINEAVADNIVPANQYIRVRYEDLLKNPKRQLKTVSDFLGITWSKKQIKDAIEANKFSSSKEYGGTSIRLGGEVRTIALRDVVIEPEGFFRVGKTGSWKDIVTTEQEKELKTRWAEKFKSVGYVWQ